MFLDAEEIFRQKQFLKKNKKAARELALFNQKLDIKKQKENINKKIKQSLIKKNKINIQNDLIFQHSINTENELIEYIASIKSRMYKNDLNSVNKNIKNIYLDIIKNINKFQEFKKEQFNITQKEIEAKTLEIFRIKEKQEKEILLNKIKENENVFQKMENEKNEIALIKDDFKHANNVYDFHVNKYEELRLSKEVLIMENKGLEKLIKDLKNKQKNLINKFNIKFNTNLNEKQIEKLNEIDFSDLIEENNNNNKEENVYVTEEILNEKDFDENNSLIENLKFNLNNNNKEKNFNNKSKNLSNISIKTNANTNKTYLNLIEKIERNSDYLNKIILSLTEENKKIKNEFSSILFKHSMINRNKNNLKILIEKCIEDINYEYKNLKEKFKFNINKGLIPKNIPKLKKVENELYLLSYIHDNCLGGKKILIRNNSLIMTKNYPNKIKRLFSAKI